MATRMAHVGMRVFAEGQNYEEWVEDLGFYIMGMGLGETDDTRKLGLFITCGGAKVKEVYMLNKSETKAKKQDGTTDVSEYQHARNVVDKKMKVSKNATYEAFRYRNLSQREGESFAHFVHRCEVGVSSCGFSAGDKNRHIRDQVVFGTTNTAIREKALSENLELNELTQKGLGIESSTKLGSSMRIKEEPAFAVFGGNSDGGARRGSSHGRSRNLECYKCGGVYPHEGSCPARDHQCPSCKRYGHFKEFCNGNSGFGRGQRGGWRGSRGYGSRGYNGQRGGQSRGYSGQRGGRSGANNVTYEGEGQEYEQTEQQVEVAQSLQAATESDMWVFATFDASKLKGRVNILIDNKVPVQFLPDTGASVNIIDRSTYDILCQSGSYPLFETNTRIFAYGSDEPLKLRGYFSAKLMFNRVSTILTIYVLNARNCGNLLSKSGCEALKIVEICASVNAVSGCNNQVAGGTNANISGCSVPANSINDNISDTITEILDKFPSGVGKLKDFQLKLDIDESVEPVIQTPRRVPFSARALVEEKLREYVEQDIIEKVDEPTVWLSPIHIVKQPDKLRMVVDMSIANKAIKRNRRVLPTPEEVFCELDGAQVFSKIDMNSAYHQIELHPDSRYITTFATHVGNYRHKTLFFGCNAASDAFDKCIQERLAGLRGVKCIADDILVFAKTVEEHDAYLKALLTRLLEAGLTINRKKCVMRAREVSFFGHWVSAAGVRPMIKDTLRELKRPQTKPEVRSFMGLVNFIGKYIPGFSTVIAPISDMLGKRVEFVWGKQQEAAFQVILREIKSPRLLKHFDPAKKTEVIVDASPVGLCAILTQEEKPVLFVSRKLSKVESRYSQTEREALAVVWACERLHFYLYGIDFVVYSDHKPLEILYSPKGKPAARILRWYIRLLPYRFVVRYRRGSDNPADYFSRKPVDECSGEEETLASETECFVSSILVDSTPSSITLQEIMAESLRDPMLSKLRDCINSGKWSEQGMTGYKQVRRELMCKNGIVLRGQRMVLPSSLRERALKLAHSTHMGMTRTKQFIRSKLWWPGLDNDVEEMIKRCTVCLAVNPEGGEKLEPLRITPFPERPFSTVHIDLFGPLPSGETIFGIIDEFSKWPELYVLKGGVSTQDIVGSLDKLFATYGLVDQVVSDNGPQFRSWKFANYMASKGIKHHLVTPYYPQANSSIERLFRGLKKFVKACSLEKLELRDKLCDFLRMYRNTPSRGTGRTPASVILGYDPRTELPGVNKSPGKQFQDLKQYSEEYKLKAKSYTDKTNNRRESTLKEGDVVFTKNLRPRKADPVYFDHPFTVLRRRGNQVQLEGEDGKVYKRPLDHLKKVPASLNNFRSNVLNRTDRPKIDCDKFRSKIFQHFDSKSSNVDKSSDIDKSNESEAATGSRVRRQFKPWQHPHGDSS